MPGIVTAMRTTGSSRASGSRTRSRREPGHQRGHLRLHLVARVAVGDSVLVSGTVRDFYPLSSGDSVATTSNLSVTEIGTPTVIVRLHGNALPAPVVIGPDTVPDTYAPGPQRGQHRVDADHAGRSALDY